MQLLIQSAYLFEICSLDTAKSSSFLVYSWKRNFSFGVLFVFVLGDKTNSSSHFLLRNTS